MYTTKILKQHIQQLLNIIYIYINNYRRETKQYFNYIKLYSFFFFFILFKFIQQIIHKNNIFEFQKEKKKKERKVCE